MKASGARNSTMLPSTSTATILNGNGDPPT